MVIALRSTAIGAFGSRTEAEQAVLGLLAAGFSPGQVGIVLPDAVAPAAGSEESGGTELWVGAMFRRLAGVEIPDSEILYYEEVLQEGHPLVMVRAGRPAIPRRWTSSTASAASTWPLSEPRRSRPAGLSEGSIGAARRQRVARRIAMRMAESPVQFSNRRRAMAEHSVVGVYKALGAAEAAVRSLGDGGFPIQKVSIIAKNLEDDRRIHGYVTACDVARSSASTGAWVGGVFGLLAGAAFLWVPGFGPLIVAGSLASALLGGIEGAVAGAAVTGVFGWLLGLGVSQDKILKYEEAVKAGKFLVIAHGPADTVGKARKILAGSGAEPLEMHSPAGA